MGERRELININDYPSNSHRSKETGETVERKEVKKVVKGKVTKQKKTLGRRMTESFLGEDGGDVKSIGAYVLYDVLIPAAKDTIANVVTDSIQMLLFGNTTNNKDSHVTRDRSRSYVSYQKYYDREDKRNGRTANRAATHDFDDIILESRQEAEEVLSNLVDLVDTYGEVTVSDFYDLIGMSSTFADRKWGWTNLSSAYVERVRNGYLIRLPRTRALD